MMMNKYLLFISCVLVVFFIALWFYLFPHMPDSMASHWNVSWDVDWYFPKLFGLFLMPIVSVFILIIFSLIPIIDPLKKNIEKFRYEYELFIFLLIIFLFYLHTLILVWNYWITFNMQSAVLPAIGLLFLYIGVFLKKAKRNWFIWIRTPWTLSSDKVWQATHIKWSKLFKLAWVLTMTWIFFGKYAIYLVIVPIVFFSIYLVIDSYFLYNKLEKNCNKLKK